MSLISLGEFLMLAKFWVRLNVPLVIFCSKSCIPKLEDVNGDFKLSWICMFLSLQFFINHHNKDSGAALDHLELWIVWIKNLLFKRWLFEPHNSQIHGHICIELVLLVILVEISWKIEHYSLSYVWLKFCIHKWFYSILSILDDLFLVIAWSVFTMKRSLEWCSCFWFLDISRKIWEFEFEVHHLHFHLHEEDEDRPC